MTKTNIPRWFRVYLRIYGILHILLVVPSGSISPIGGLLMLVSGISALIAKRWGAFPITILVLSATPFSILKMIPIALVDGAYFPLAGLSLLLAVEWFTAIMYWRVFFRHKTG